MKLLGKSTLFYSLWLLPVIILSGFFMYEIISWQIDESTDESILKEKNLIITSFDASKENETVAYHYGDGEVIVQAAYSVSANDVFADSERYDSIDQEVIPYRMLTSGFVKGSKTFSITITRSVIESDELAEGIAKALVLLFGVMMLGFLTVNRILSRRLWKPFNESLDRLNTLSFAELQPEPFKKSTVKEFDQLSASLNRMTGKMLNDFNNQKQFTENAAHELQTPLAVIKAKLDLLIQSKNISGMDLELIEKIESSVNKLSQLNKSLLLLSKIENRQFEESADVALPDLADKVLDNFIEHIIQKNIIIDKKYLSRTMIRINPHLAEILFTNLIQNAIRYNRADGTLSIRTAESGFSICNSGDPLNGPAEAMFNRFKKFNTAPESLGLGLAIVKQICSYYGWNISYSYVDLASGTASPPRHKEFQHCFEISF